MGDGHRRPSPGEIRRDDAAWLSRVAHEASRGVGGIPVERLGAATLRAADLDMNLVAWIVQLAGVRCSLETPDDSTTAILAEPRLQNGQMHWAVRATRIRAPDRDRCDHVCVGPNDDRRMAMRISEPDERHLAALIVAQALRVDPEETLTFDEVEALGLR